MHDPSGRSRAAFLARVLALWLIAAIPGLAAGQTTPDRTAAGSIAGRILDASGTPIPGVAVTLTSTSPASTGTASASSAARNVFSDASGHYRFTRVAPGVYTIAAELSGFRPATTSAIDVQSDAARTVDLTLTLASIAESVTVFGERSERSLKDTAASVAVFDARTLERRPGFDASNNVLALIPNVTVSGTTNMAPAVRGVDGTGPAQGADAFFAGTRARLNVQVDGRPTSYNEVVFGDTGLWDVEQVEVFRGSQSTLQGRNAVAGTVVVKTKDPTYHRETLLRVGGGTFDSRGIAGAISGPIVDKQLAYRFTFDRRSSESFARFTPYDRVESPGAFDLLTLRGKLLIEPKALNGFTTLVTVNHASFEGPQTESLERPFGEHRASSPFMPVFEPTSTSVIFDTTWKRSDRLSFENTLSYTGVRIERKAEPGDGNALIDGRELVIEPRVRFAGWGGRLKGFGGLYVFNAHQDETIDLFGGGAFDDKTTTVAGFGEATMTLRRDLDLTVGGRWEREDRRRTGADGPFRIDFDETYRVFSPKAGLAWRATDAVTVGANVSRGYNAGAAGFTFEPPFVSYTFEPEFVWNYEAFGRADLKGGRLSLTGNVFFSDYTDMQLPFDLNPDPRVWSFVVRNADEARTYGAELGARWAGFPGWQFFADVGLLKTEITRFAGSGVEGHELAQSPAFTSTVGIAYQHASGVDAALDARFSDAYFSNVTNDPRGKVDPYWLVNAQIGYTISHVRLYAVLSNLFDSDAAILVEPGDTTADDTGSILRPRGVSLNLRVAF